MGGRFALMLVFSLAILATAGCGGGESTGSSSDGADEPELYPWVKGPAREFISSHGLTATFGREASRAEREQASRVVTAWMRARAATNWAVECKYFSRRYLQALVVEDAEKVSHGKVKNCRQALAYFGPLASGDYKNNLTGPIDSLRVREGQGYALYHGRDSRDWSLGMDKEDGRWWVGLAAPIPQDR